LLHKEKKERDREKTIKSQRTVHFDLINEEENVFFSEISASRMG
jgi:hypothetical protein